MRKHERDMHLNRGRKYECNLCHREYSSLNSLQVHRSNSHPTGVVRKRLHHQNSPRSPIKYETGFYAQQPQQQMQQQSMQQQQQMFHTIPSIKSHDNAASLIGLPSVSHSDEVARLLPDGSSVPSSMIMPTASESLVQNSASLIMSSLSSPLKMSPPKNIYTPSQYSVMTASSTKAQAMSPRSNIGKNECPANAYSRLPNSSHGGGRAASSDFSIMNNPPAATASHSLPPFMPSLCASGALPLGRPAGRTPSSSMCSPLPYIPQSPTRASRLTDTTLFDQHLAEAELQRQLQQQHQLAQETSLSDTFPSSLA
ncbi:hypothetical protein HAZT_HAZT012230 [Hyalella azteca]|uniref:C2H2-type domain-containing protein n=1 Tax=Hyalella azteca TaxID=294128 RepID=A0A6A0H9C1_HYAAZ|nr:hypothetical protein HAZT_HAZT012230 [Hyalella azteca]